MNSIEIILVFYPLILTTLILKLELKLRRKIKKGEEVQVRDLLLFGSKNKNFIHPNEK